MSLTCILVSVQKDCWLLHISTILCSHLFSSLLLSQVCVWCWNHIMEMADKDNSEGRCPACRTPYDKEKIVGMAANCDRL
jgi:hypothetical protein